MYEVPAAAPIGCSKLVKRAKACSRSSGVQRVIDAPLAGTAAGSARVTGAEHASGAPSSTRIAARRS
jgi:hypothetical protein